MDIWELLGIPPTNDIGKIKSAYARQAKLYHPEEQPEQFKALQRAYKTAVKTAKRQEAKMPDVPPVQIPGPDVKESVNSSAKETEEEEHFYDYSDVDTYGEREQFFKQFFLIEKNPYLKNNLDAWDYFLNEYSKLFVNTKFRMNFVRTVCSHCGWRRKTILYFKRYLHGFHTETNKPSDGKWETGCLRFRIRQLPWLKFPAFLTNRFWTREGKDFQKDMLAKVGGLLGREPDLKIKDDLIKYIGFYLEYGASKEEYMKHLCDVQRQRQAMVKGTIIVICIFFVLKASYSMEQRRETKERLSRAGYYMELYDLESDNYSDEEKEKMVKDYDAYWRYAEEAIDDVLNRYDDWTLQE